MYAQSIGATMNPPGVEAIEGYWYSQDIKVYKALTVYEAM